MVRKGDKEGGIPIIYFDHAATTPALPCAIEAFQRAPFGNPSSEHGVGQRAREMLENAREVIATCIHAEPGQIIFTSGATEGCALVANTMTASWVSPYEHHAVLGQFRVDKRNGILIANMLANNETGEVYRMPEKGKGYIFSDATAALGHMPVDVEELGVDYLVAGAHKFGGLPGAGFVYTQTGLLNPILCGGGQESGMRAGTESVGLICAMAAALKWQTEHMEENMAKTRKCRDYLVERLSTIDGVLINTPLDRSLPNILNVSFRDVNGHALVLLCSNDGLMISAGAACGSGENEPSRVIMAMFGDVARARGAVRISLSHENTIGECESAVEIIKKNVTKLRKIINPT